MQYNWHRVFDVAPPADKQPTPPESSQATAEAAPSSAVESAPAEAVRDTAVSRDTLQDADVATTDLSLQHATDPTLLSNAEPAGEAESRLAARVRDLELKQDALLARVRLLEKGGENPLPRPGIWLLFLPLVAFLWWLVQRLGGG